MVVAKLRESVILMQRARQNHESMTKSWCHNGEISVRNPVF